MSPDGPLPGDEYCNFKDNWGSAHKAGAHSVFGDSSVRMLMFDVDAAMMAALLTPDGGETVTPP